MGESNKSSDGGWGLRPLPDRYRHFWRLIAVDATGVDTAANCTVDNGASRKALVNAERTHPHACDEACGHHLLLNFIAVLRTLVSMLCQ